MSKPASPVLQSGNPLATGLIRAVSFTDGSGSTITDYAATPYHITTRTSLSTASGSWGTDSDPNVGGYVEFDGATQDARGADTGLPIGASPRTVIILVKPVGTTGGWVFGSGTAGDGRFAFGVGHDTSFLDISTTGNNFNIGTTAFDGAWHWVGFTFDGAHLKYILDGIYVDSPFTIPGMDVASSGFLYLAQVGGTGGSEGDGTNGPFSAFKIAGLFVWDKSLSDSELANHYADPWALLTIPPPISAGTVSFVSSGVGGIVLTSTDASGDTSPYTYQWQRNTDGGSYSNLSNGSGVSGATTLNLTDGSATTGHLYGYKLVFTGSDSDTITSNIITAEVYSGGPLSGGFSTPFVGRSPFIQG